MPNDMEKAFTTFTLLIGNGDESSKNLGAGGTPLANAYIVSRVLADLLQARGRTIQQQIEIDDGGPALYISKQLELPEML